VPDSNPVLPSAAQGQAEILTSPSGTLPAGLQLYSKQLRSLRAPPFASSMATVDPEASSAVVEDESSPHAVTQDAPWPGMCSEGICHEEEASMPWPGLDISHNSTTEAEEVVLRSGAEPAGQHPVPRWSGDGHEGGSASPDSPLSFSQNSPARMRSAKRVSGRTYFNSSRSISSQESSPHAPAATALSSPLSQGLHTFVRSPRWAEQQMQNNHQHQQHNHQGSSQSASASGVSRAPQSPPPVASSLGSAAGVLGSLSGTPSILPPAQSQMLQQKAAATASWVANGAAFGSNAKPLASPFAALTPLGQEIGPTRMHTADSSSNSHHLQGRFGRTRTLSAPERRGAEHAKAAGHATNSPTKSGGSPAEPRAAAAAQAAWAVLGADSPSRQPANTAFLRWPLSSACPTQSAVRGVAAAVDRAPVGYVKCYLQL
jgi:hypothetical protein